MTDRARRSWFAGLLALIGGGAIVAGSLLTWLDVGGGVSVGSTSVTGTPTGNELLLGQVALGAGVAVVILGLLLLVLRRAKRFLGFLVILGGLAAIAAGTLAASSPEDRYIEFAVEKGAPTGQADEVRASLTNLFEASGLEVDLGIGLYIAVGGGALALIGGLTAVFGRRKPKQVEEAVQGTKGPSEPEPGLPEEWLAARALEAEARAPDQEPPPQELVPTAVSPPLPDPPPEPEDAPPWRSPLPEAPESPPEAESPPEEEPVARPEEIEAPSDATEEPAPVPEPLTQTIATPEPSEEPAKTDGRADWSKPLPDDWVAKPAKRRRRRRS